MTKEIPLLFTPENRALVRQGLKTETRREMIPQPDPAAAKLEHFQNNIWVPCSNSGKIGIFSPDTHKTKYGCPQREPVTYWMKEPVQVLGLYEGDPGSGPWADVVYLGDGENSMACSVKITLQDWQKLHERKDWRKPYTAMFMLKSFTRTWLPGVRVWPEQLGDMSEESALAEGIKALSKDGGTTIKYGLPDADGLPGEAMAWQDWQMHPVTAYRYVWESINGPGSWQADKWTWAIEFEPPSEIE